MAEPFEFGNPEIVEEELDILLIGGGMACCGAAFEIMRWAEGTGLKIKLVDKAATARSARGSCCSRPRSSTAWARTTTRCTAT